MVDKIKPLKLENSLTGGTELDMFPTEADPSADYVAAKGLSFENSNDYLAEKVGRALGFKIPDGSQKITYSGNDITAVEFFTTASQITANRIARVDMTYSGVNPATEAWKFYDTDGTTTLRTVTLTYTFSGIDLINYVEATT